MSRLVAYIARLTGFIALMWINVQVRMIKYKMSVLTWQFDRLLKKVSKKVSQFKVRDNS